MKEFEDLKAYLKPLISADNVEQMADLSSKLEAVEKAQNELHAENKTLRDKLVEVVKNTSFKDTPQEEVSDTEPDLDTILQQEFNNLTKEK